ncbi:hypothetical protein HRI_001220700 [Hibiscus trionum]|uniref:Uncharacterized protein n=1 Tax=Hibiscus trionum TaxID=183268 RepID=A0A9W7LSH9_HIBTR|nr:hypothetical protein HRI_001220700 [Hibiscus trionum]
MDSHVPSNPNEESWTEEKHTHFLNSMEAWFVRTVLENNDRFNLRLDRHLPDTCDSTLDCKQNARRRKKHTNSGSIGTNRSRMKFRPHKRSTRPPSQRRASPQDQVVPQIENRREDSPKFPASSKLI